jgi:acylglycerol lipase
MEEAGAFLLISLSSTMLAMPECQTLRLRYSDGYEAFARIWLPGQPAGGLLYLHGIQSHGGWFEASAERLARQCNLAVLLPDRRGSGRNDRDRGHAPSARRLILDCIECLDELHVRTGAPSFHVLGVSWGGKQALALWPHAPHRIASLTLVAPGVFPLVDMPLGEKIRVALSILAAPRATFAIPLNEPELFTADPKWQTFIRTDPLKLTRVTTSFLMTSRRLDRYARAVERDPTGCPLRVFLAGRDRIIDTPRTRQFVRGLSWPCRGLTEYPDAAHTLEFEPDPEPYLRDLVDWIREVSTSPATVGK